MCDNIASLNDYQKNINIEFIVIKHIDKNVTKDNCVVNTYIVADESGSIEVSIWDEEFCIGDIISFNDCYTSLYKDKKRVFLSGNGHMRRVGFLRKEFTLSKEHAHIMDEDFKDIIKTDKNLS